jgi:hypothetical protein
VTPTDAVRPGSPPLKVYLSSTLNDLGEERTAIKQVLGDQCVVKESYNAREDDLRASCRDDIRTCDLYIGVIGLRYGFIPDGETSSITQLEFEEAATHRIPRLVFIKDEAEIKLAFTDADAQGGLDRIRRFRTYLQSPRPDGIRPALFKTLTDLREAVLKSFNEFRDRLREERERTAPPPPTKQTRAARVRDEKSYQSVNLLQAALEGNKDPDFEPTLVHRLVRVRRPNAHLICHEDLVNVSGEARNELIRLVASDSPIDATDLEAKAQLTINGEPVAPSVTVLDASPDGHTFKVRFGFRGHPVESGKTLGLQWEAEFPASVALNEDYWVFPCLYERPVTRLICEAVFPHELADFSFFRVTQNSRQPEMMRGPFREADGAAGTFLYRAEQRDTADMYLMTWRLR